MMHIRLIETGIMGVLLRLTWKSSKQSVNEFITVCPPPLPSSFSLSNPTLSQGKFVSESKFAACPSSFIPHIQNPNPSALEALITKPEVERALLERLAKKAYIYGHGLIPDGRGDRRTGDIDPKIDASDVKMIYEEVIIPLTKRAEVRSCSSPLFYCL